MVKKHVKIQGMHCTSCAMLIEGELEDIGVNAKCSYAKSSVDMEFDEKKISENDIEIAIKKAGYTLAK